MVADDAFGALPLEERHTYGDLVSEILARTPREGPNTTEWPGLTAYRFNRPQRTQWSEVGSLALCCVVQGRKRFSVDGDQYVCDPFHYLLFTRGMRFETEILEATQDTPYLSFVLQIDPSVVRLVATDITERRHPAGAKVYPTSAPAAHVSPFHEYFMGSVLRFLRALGTAPDRRVLAPIHLQEITYRLMRAEQVSRLLQAAARERRDDPLACAIQYFRENLAAPLTVADLANHVRMSPSALTALFAQATGMGPYQFLKRMRLDRAATLLIQEQLTVTEVARRVGYSSPSHFTNEFRRFFGVTPRRYAETQRDVVAMRVDEATAPETEAPPPELT